MNNNNYLIRHDLKTMVRREVMYTGFVYALVVPAAGGGGGGRGGGGWLINVLDSSQLLPEPYKNKTDNHRQDVGSNLFPTDRHLNPKMYNPDSPQRHIK